MTILKSAWLKNLEWNWNWKWIANFPLDWRQFPSKQILVYTTDDQIEIWSCSPEASLLVKENQQEAMAPKEQHQFGGKMIAAIIRHYHFDSV